VCLAPYVVVINTIYFHRHNLDETAYLVTVKICGTLLSFYCYELPRGRPIFIFARIPISRLTHSQYRVYIDTVLDGYIV
jgi:hypothetical protein